LAIATLDFLGMSTAGAMGHDRQKTLGRGVELRPASPGCQLVAARLDADLTQACLAQRLGVRAATVARWESDRAVPGERWLGRLSEILGVSVHELYVNWYSISPERRPSAT